MSDTREKIIEIADQLIRTKGYNAFSYADISTPLAIKNAAIHYHFPNKCDLGISVIEREMARFEASRREWENIPADEQLKKLSEMFQQCSKKGFICLVGSLTPDYDTFQPAMQQKVQEMCKNILNWMADCLERGRTTGLFHFEGDAFDKALVVMSNLMSSLLFSRVLGNNIFGRMNNQLSKVLN